MLLTPRLFSDIGFNNNGVGPDLDAVPDLADFRGEILIFQIVSKRLQAW